jgi:nucleoside phosphorylase
LNGKLRKPRVVILTALLVERQAISSHLLQLHEEIHPEGTVYWSGIFPCKGCIWDVKLVEIGPGNSGASFETERAISYFNPDVTFFTGVAGGLKDVRIGDVVAATRVYNYESGKASVTFQPRPEVGNSTYRMVSRARAEVGSKDWLRRIKGAMPILEPKVHVGPIAAGEKVVSSIRSTTYELLQANYGDVLAIEMEGHGFLSTTHTHQFVNALVIRGISDLIEGKSEADATNSQELASRHASAFAFQILFKLGEDKHFLQTIVGTRSTNKTRNEGQSESKYYVQNSGQMAVGDNAQMVVNNWVDRSE